MTKGLQIIIFYDRKNFTPIISKSGDIANQSEENIFSNLTVSLWGPPRVQFSIRFFFPGKIFYVKRPQLSDAPKIGTITPSS